MKATKSSFLISFIAAGMFLIVGSNAAAVEPAGTSVNASGRNVLIIGHSLTHCLRALEPLAPMVGHPEHKQMLYSHLGAGIAYHYQTETNQWTPVSHFPHIAVAFSPSFRKRLLTALCWRRGGRGLVTG